MFFQQGRFLFIKVFIFTFAFGAKAQQKSLKEFVDLAIQNNFSLRASEFETVAAKKESVSASMLESPRVGVSQLNRGSETKYWTLSQNVKFPSKYYYKGKVKSATSHIFKIKQGIKTLSIRSEVTSSLYEYYANQQIQRLTKNNLGLVKDAARIAEKRYAARKSSQSDSMKAHFEITRLELELLKIQNKHADIAGRLRTLFGDSKFDMNMLESIQLSVPELIKMRNGDFIKSPYISIQEFQLEVARLEKNSSLSDMGPDFQIQYQERYSGLPENSSIFSINASIPLWFWSDVSKVSSKRARYQAEKNRLSQKALELKALKISLEKKIQLMKQSLVIYQTTMLPQAEGVFSTTKKSYSAGALSFLDLLDAERSLIRVKTEFFEELAKYVRLIVQYETIFGVSISNLYFIDGEIQS